MKYTIITAILALGLAGCNLSGVNFDVSGLPSLEVNGDCAKNPPQDGGGNCRLVWKNPDSNQPVDKTPPIVDNSDSDDLPIPADQIQTVSLPTGIVRYGGDPSNSSLAMTHSSATTDGIDPNTGALLDSGRGFIYIEADFSNGVITEFKGYRVAGDNQIYPNGKFGAAENISIDSETGEISGTVSKNRNQTFDVTGRFTSDGSGISGELVGKGDWGEGGNRRGLFQADKFALDRPGLPTGSHNYDGTTKIIIDKGGFGHDYFENESINITVDFDSKEFTKFQTANVTSHDVTIDTVVGTFSGEVDYSDRVATYDSPDQRGNVTGYFMKGGDSMYGKFSVTETCSSSTGCALIIGNFSADRDTSFTSASEESGS